MYTHGRLIVLAFLVLGNYDNVYTWLTYPCSITAATTMYTHGHLNTMSTYSVSFTGIIWQWNCIHMVI